MYQNKSSSQPSKPHDSTETKLPCHPTWQWFLELPSAQTWKRPDHLRRACRFGRSLSFSSYQVEKPGDLRLCWAISKWNPTGNHFFHFINHGFLSWYPVVLHFFDWNPHVSWEIIWDLGLWKIDGSCVGTKSHHWNHCWSILHHSTIPITTTSFTGESSTKRIFGWIYFIHFLTLPCGVSHGVPMAMG